MKKLISLCSLLVLSASAVAESHNYYGVSFGQGKAQTSGTVKDLEAAAIQSGVSNVSGFQDNSSLSYKIFAGVRATPYFGVEAGYARLGTAKLGLSGSVAGTYAEVKQDVRAIAGFVDLVGTLPVNKYFSAFGKVGFAYTQTEVDAKGQIGVFHSSYHGSANEVVPKYGVGLEVRMAKNLMLRGEFERYVGVGNSTTGESDVDNLTVGLAFAY